MQAGQQKRRRVSPARSAIGVVVIIGLVVLARQVGHTLPALVHWVDGLGAWGPVGFVLVYAVAVVALVPGAILTLAGGAIFGLFWGTVYVFIAAVIGSSGRSWWLATWHAVQSRAASAGVSASRASTAASASRDSRSCSCCGSRPSFPSAS